jgi:heme/copper-type cytochrome/quinol oxidase subunit 2
MVVLMKFYSGFSVVSLAALLAVWTAAQEPDSKPDKVISITAERFAFSPSKIRVRKGSIVELVITSEDTDHGFRIPRATAAVLNLPLIPLGTLVGVCTLGLLLVFNRQYGRSPHSP